MPSLVLLLWIRQKELTQASKPQTELAGELYYEYNLKKA